MTITYHHSKQLAFTPAFTFVVEAFASMLRDNLAHPCFDWGNASEVVWATDEKKLVVCAQVFNQDSYGRVFTHLAYTLPEYRGQSLAVNVFNHLEKTVMARPNTVGLYTTCVDENDTVKKVFEKTGRNLFLTITSQRISTWDLVVNKFTTVFKSPTYHYQHERQCGEK